MKTNYINSSIIIRNRLYFLSNKKRYWKEGFLTFINVELIKDYIKYKIQNTKYKIQNTKYKIQNQTLNKFLLAK